MEISERVSRLMKFDYSKSFKKQLNQYELLKNFIVLKINLKKDRKLQMKYLIYQVSLTRTLQF